MTRHRTTYITDDDGKVEHGSYVVEPLIEPRHQRFIVDVAEGDVDFADATPTDIANMLTTTYHFASQDTVIAVEETEP